MSYYDDASLMLLASGGAQKDGKAYSIKPTDGTGDFTFTRGSNLSATRVNASQLIEKGRENVVLESNSFSTSAWSKGNITLTSGQSGYDGSNDAWLLESNAITSTANLVQGISNPALYTSSIYAKAGTSNWIRISATGSNSVYYDLGNGVVGSTTGSNFVDKSIESVGNGWYRCSVTFNGRDNFYVFIANGDLDSATNSGDNILIQDAQLEQGLVATSVIKTGASTAQAGILENTPRFDYSGGASCPSLLLEPSRTNLVVLSEYFAGWSNVINVTPTSNYIISPEGVQNATRSQFTANGYYYNSNAPAQVAGTQYTLSCYAKRNDSGTQDFGFFTNGSGAVNSAMALTSEWKRFYYTYTAATTSQLGLAGLSGADVSIYGFQAEVGSYATSYIPTYGVSQTRAQDDCRESSATSLIGQPEGTIYWEGSIVSVSYQGANIASFNYLTSSSVSLERQSNGTIRGRIWTPSGAVVNIITLGSSYDGNVKIAFAYKSGDTTLYINGVQIGTSSTAFTFGSALTEFNLGAGDVYFAHPHKSEVKEALLFKTRLSNADCETLTT